MNFGISGDEYARLKAAHEASKTKTRCPWSGVQCDCSEFPWKDHKGNIPKKCKDTLSKT